MTPSETYSEEELIDCLRSASDTLGETPSFAGFREFSRSRRLADGRPWPRSHTYHVTFGSWTNALKAAGLTQKAARKTYSDDELIDRLRTANDVLHGALSYESYDELARSGRSAGGVSWPSIGTYLNRFGSWRRALNAVGLEAKSKPKRYSEAELMQCLKQASDELGQTPTFAAYNEFARGRRLPDGRPWPMSATQLVRFGSWRSALNAAGLEVKERPKRYSEAELITCMRQAAGYLAADEVLSRAAYDELASARRLSDGRAWPMSSAHHARFGSWARALKATGLQVRKTRRRYSEAELMQCLKQASDALGRTPTFAAYNEFARGRRFADGRPWPSHRAHQETFGSWSSALQTAGVRLARRADDYSEAELLDCLRRASDALGGAVTAVDYEQFMRRRTLAHSRPWPAAHTYTRTFGSWTNALRAAGLQRKARENRYSDAELISCLRHAGKALGGTLTRASYDEIAPSRRFPDGRPWPTARTHSVRFGSWTNALTAAGLQRKARENRYSDDELIMCLRRAGGSRRVVLTRARYAAYAHGQRFSDRRRWPVAQTYYERFGSWDDALRAAGLPPTGRSGSYTDGELFECLQRASDALGDALSRRGYDELADTQTLPDGRPWPKHRTQSLRFGSWANALKMADLSSPPQRTDDEPSGTFDRADCVDAVRFLEIELGASPTTGQYRQFARELQGDIPSLSTVLKCCGTWRQAVHAAGARRSS